MSSVVVSCLKILSLYTFILLYDQPMMPEATTSNISLVHRPPPTHGRTNKAGNRASLQSTKGSKSKQGTDCLSANTKRILTNDKKNKNSPVLTAMHEIQLGPVSPSASTSVWTVQVCIETWVYILASSGTLDPPRQNNVFQTYISI